MNTFSMKAVLRPPIIVSIVVLTLLAGFTSASLAGDMENPEQAYVSFYDLDMKELGKSDDFTTVTGITSMIIGSEQIDMPPNTNWTHKFYFSAGKLKGIWLYNAADGIAAKENEKLKPLCKLQENEQFKKLLFSIRTAQ